MTNSILLALVCSVALMGTTFAAKVVPISFKNKKKIIGESLRRGDWKKIKDLMPEPFEGIRSFDVVGFLFRAADYGKYDIIEAICENEKLQKSINLGDVKETIELASSSHRSKRDVCLRIVKYLLTRYFTKKSFDRVGVILFWGAYYRDLNLVKYLCENYKIKGLNEGLDINRALKEAARRGHFNIVKYFYENKNTRKLITTKGAKEAAESNIYPEIVEYLEENEISFLTEDFSKLKIT